MRSKLSSTKKKSVHRGMVVVLYGRETFPTSIQLDSGQAADVPGLSRIVGRDNEDHFGSQIHSTDLNQDGLDELIVGSGLERRSAAMGEEDRIEAHNFEAGDGPDGRRVAALLKSDWPIPDAPPKITS